MSLQLSKWFKHLRFILLPLWLICSFDASANDVLQYPGPVSSPVSFNFQLSDLMGWACQLPNQSPCTNTNDGVGVIIPSGGNRIVKANYGTLTKGRYTVTTIASGPIWLRITQPGNWTTNLYLNNSQLITNYLPYSVDFDMPADGNVDIIVQSNISNPVINGGVVKIQSLSITPSTSFTFVDKTLSTNWAVTGGATVDFTDPTYLQISGSTDTGISRTDVAVLAQSYLLTATGKNTKVTINGITLDVDNDLYKVVPFNSAGSYPLVIATKGGTGLIKGVNLKPILDIPNPGPTRSIVAPLGDYVASTSADNGATWQHTYVSVTTTPQIVNSANGTNFRFEQGPLHFYAPPTNLRGWTYAGPNVSFPLDLTNLDALAAIGVNFIRVRGDTASYPNPSNLELTTLTNRISYACDHGMKSSILSAVGGHISTSQWSNPALVQSNFIIYWTTVINALKTASPYSLINDGSPGSRDCVLGYDLSNEPTIAGTSLDDQIPTAWRNIVAQPIINAIRAIDTQNWIIYEPGEGGFANGFNYMQPFADAKVIYSYHIYNTMGYTYQNFSNFSFMKSGSVTIIPSLGNPEVITWSSHGRAVNDPVVFATTGALPAPLAVGTNYYVKTVLDANSFTVSATPGPGGTAIINTSGTQSGLHTATAGIGSIDTNSTNPYPFTGGTYPYNGSTFPAINISTIEAAAFHDGDLFEAKYQTPIYIGEFDVAKWAPGAEFWFKDIISLLEKRHWIWTAHGWRESQMWGIERDQSYHSVVEYGPNPNIDLLPSNQISARLCQVAAGVSLNNLSTSFYALPYSPTDCDHDGILDSTDTYPLNQNDPYNMSNNPPISLSDQDKDGVPNTLDKFPLNAAASVDTDGDGMPDSWNINNPYGCAVNAPTCNGLTLDKFSLNAAASVDTDGDGMPDSWNVNNPYGCAANAPTCNGLTLDADNDNDGLLNTVEATLGTDPLSFLDPPRVYVFPDHLFGFEDPGNVQGPNAATYNEWNVADGTWMGVGTFYSTVTDLAEMYGTYGCYLIAGTVDCGGGNTLANVKKFKVGGALHACALLTDNSVQCWENANIAARRLITTGLSNILDISVGVNNACVVNGSAVYCWNSAGTTPVPITGILPLPAVLVAPTAVAVGDNHACAIDSGSVKCWSWDSNSMGQLNGIPGVTSAKNIAAGTNHTCVINGDYGNSPIPLSVSCWGNNAHSQTYVPSGTYALVNPVVISASSNETCVVQALTGYLKDTLTAQTSMKCWPVNFSMTSTPVDSDGDGLTDAAEAAIGTNPWSADTDGDCIPDNIDPSPLSASGALDCSFGGTGKVVTGIATGSPTDDESYAAIQQADGKIVQAGFSKVGSYYNFALVRYNMNGSLDTTFCQSSGNCTGKITTSIATNKNAYATSMIQQTDGKLVVAGYYFTSGTTASTADFALVRYNLDGSLDSTFGTGGILKLAFSANEDRIQSVIQQTDGKLVVAGYSKVSGIYNFALARFTINGSLDTNFNSNGKLTTPIVSGQNAYAYSVIQQTDSKLVVAGNTGNGTNVDFALARFNTNGTFDTTFGGTGKVNTNISHASPAANQNDYAYSVIQQLDGKLVAAGYSYTNSTSGNDFALARYNTNGTLDTTSFGISSLVPGTVITAVSSSGSLDDQAYSIVRQSDGKLVAGGKSTGGLSNPPEAWNVYALVRYNSDGTLDASFNSSGIVTTRFSNVPTDNANGNSLILQSDGKLVLSGFSNFGALYLDFSMARYFH